MKEIVVIGGGAAGLAAAVASAWKARQMGVPVRVRVFEADDRVGRSILATGNGRCNFTNAQLYLDKYWNVNGVRPVLDALEEASIWPKAGDNAVQDFFAALGLAWRTEAEGRMYPVTGKASTVLNVLRRAAGVLDVQECCGCGVASVEPPRPGSDHFTLRMKDGRFERAHRMVVACGGAVARSLLPEDLQFQEQCCVLGPLATDTEYVRALDNIRVRCGVALEREGAVVAHEQGELLFRKYGVSGIAVFNLSRWAQPGDALVIDFLPDCDNVYALLSDRKTTLEMLLGREASSEEILEGLLLPLVAEALLKRSGGSMKALAKMLKHFTLQVKGPGDVKQCQVHRGGFALDGFCLQTMECVTIPGLYAAGEMLDVDGPCGGYNLHWAWSSGLLAGLSAVERSN